MIGQRPRLVDSVGPRRHVVDGVPIVVLENAHTGRGVRLDPREWLIASAADGTRDVDGIALFASSCGVYRGIGEIRALLQRLSDEGLLTDGLAFRPAESESTASIARDGALDRPLDVLPDYSLHCDGSGTCCRFYGTVLFRPDEAIRGLALVPEVAEELGSIDHVFLPQRMGGSRGMAVAQVDGACAFLSGRECRIHRAGGASAKPVGCRSYPLRLVDDGETVRVSIRVECRCVLDSVGREGGEPLVAAGARTAADVLSAGIATLPERIALTETSWSTSAQLATWSRAVLRRELTTDIAGVLWRLAALVERHGLDPAALDSLAEMPTFSDAEIRPWLAATAERAAAALAAEAQWRSPKDEARRTLAALCAAATTLAARDALAERSTSSASDPAEAFYLRTNIHGHQLVGSLPLATMLRDRAVRLIVSREMGPADSRPLCRVEAVMRGYSMRTAPDGDEDVAPSPTRPP